MLDKRSLRAESEVVPELLRYSGQVELLRLGGEVDATKTELLASSLLAYAVGGPADLIVDLSQITFLSAAGVHVLITFGEEFQRSGRRLLFVVSPGQVGRLLDILGVADHLSIHHSVAGATQAYLNAVEQFVNEPEEIPAAPAPDLQALVGRLVGAVTVSDVFRQVVLAAADLIPDVDLASVTLRQADGGHHTPVGSHEEAVLLDRLQYDSGEGPCVDATALAGPAQVHSDDVGTATDWPAFGPAAAERGISSVLSTAFVIEAGTEPFSGSLNLYSRARDGFDTTTRDVVVLLVGCASLALKAIRGDAGAEPPL